MAVTDTEKGVLTSVVSQLEDLASGLSGNRAAALRRLCGLLQDVADGKNMADVPLTLADQAKRGVQPEDPAFTPAQPSVPASDPAAQAPVTVDVPQAPAPAPAPTPMPSS